MLFMADNEWFMADTIAKWSKENLSVFSIISVGGNDLTSSNIRQGSSASLIVTKCKDT